MIEYVAGYIKKEQQVHEKKIKFEIPKAEFFKRIVLFWTCRLTLSWLYGLFFPQKKQEISLLCREK